MAALSSPHHTSPGAESEGAPQLQHHRNCGRKRQRLHWRCSLQVNKHSSHQNTHSSLRPHTLIATQNANTGVFLTKIRDIICAFSIAAAVKHTCYFYLKASVCSHSNAFIVNKNTPSAIPFLTGSFDLFWVEVDVSSVSSRALLLLKTAERNLLIVKYS